VAGSVVPTLDKYGFAAKDAIVIAHARRLASEAAGDTTPSDKLGTNRIILVAEASQLLRARTVNPRIKLKAITKAQWILLGLVSGLAATHLTLESACGEAGLKMDWLREAALRLALAADPSTLGPRDYAKAVRTTVDQLTWPAHVQRPSLNSHFRTPNSDQWSELGVEPSGGMRWGTVHSVKGQEFPAVIVVLPQKMIKDSSGLSVLDQWEQGVDAEPRRVLYVAASRAQSLLILATYKSHIGRVRAILTRDNVPFSLVAQ
jgi:DNA helicase-2/ATP-dependent DNA helicase PcrA